MEIKSFKITGIESTDKKTILHSDKLKYYFWLKKKDGTDTVANSQFQKFQFRVGDVIEASVNEEEREFVNDKGKTIKFTDRNIAFFNVSDQNTPKPAEIPVIQLEDTVPPIEDDRIGEILDNTRTIIDMLSPVAPVVGEDGKELPF